MGPTKTTMPWWIAAAVSAALFSMSMSGTLGGWTVGVVTHQGNTASTAGAVLLQVAGPDADGDATSCVSTTGTDNSYTCTTINLYGNGGLTQTSMGLGDINTTVVTLSNVGELDASAVSLAAGPCTGGTAVCDAMLVEITCVGGATGGTIAPTSLSNLAGSDIDLVGVLPAGGAITSTCTVVTTLSPLAGLNARDKTASQDLSWSIEV